MGVTFAPYNEPGFEAPGIVEDHAPGPPAALVKRTLFWGLKGESELRGLSGGFPLEIVVTIHDGYATHEALQTKLDQIDAAVMKHGRVQIEDNGNGFAPQWDHATFHGFRKLMGPLKDVGATLEESGGYWVQGVLAFYVLRTRG